jgi:Uri superfamily endonuclease
MSARLPFLLLRHEQMKKKERGLYLLVIHLNESKTISIGKRYPHHFEKGLYIYTGRARNGLEARIARHCRQKKKAHWHIDFFLEKATLKEVWIKPDAYDECGTVETIKDLLPESSVPFRGFGSSDCRCQGHLVHSASAETDLFEMMKNLSFRKVKIYDHYA